MLWSRPICDSEHQGCGVQSIGSSLRCSDNLKKYIEKSRIKNINTWKTQPNVNLEIVNLFIIL